MMKLWDRIEETLVGLLGLIALVIGLWQVIGRYFAPEHAISYAEEVIVYLVIWAIMFVSSQLVRRDGHVRPDVALRKLPPQVLRWVEALNCVAAIAFCAALVWYGWQIVETSIQIDERSSTDLQFPIWIYYLVAAGRRPADGGALYDPPGPLRALFRSRDDDRWPQHRPRDTKRHGCACHKPAAGLT